MPHGSRRVGVRKCVSSEGSSCEAHRGRRGIASPPSTSKARRRSSEKRRPGRTGSLRDDCRARDGSAVSWRRQSRSTSSRGANRTACLADALTHPTGRRHSARSMTAEDGADRKVMTPADEEVYPDGRRMGSLRCSQPGGNTDNVRHADDEVTSKRKHFRMPPTPAFQIQYEKIPR
jgi:hypothetical protein